MKGFLVLLLALPMFGCVSLFQRAGDVAETGHAYAGLSFSEGLVFSAGALGNGLSLRVNPVTPVCAGVHLLGAGGESDVGDWCKDNVTRSRRFQ